MHAIFELESGQKRIGDFKVKLFNEQVPKTVENFVSLAEGNKEFVDSKTSKKAKRPFYNGSCFHRVIKDFMVQGGCPEGTGTAGPGYTFEDEFHSDLKHNKSGMLSMANRGPNTNGSQFFITVAQTPHLDFDHPANKARNGGHTVFGEVVEGYDLVEMVSNVPTDHGDKPREDIIIKTIKIVRG